MTRHKKMVVSGVLLSVVIALAGCSETPSRTAACAPTIEDSEHSGMLHSMNPSDKQSFAVAMIPHHKQAVCISELAQSVSKNPELLALADQIVVEQAEEIDTMTPWLNGSEIDYGMVMDGMLTAKQLQELESASGSEFDKLYLQFMVIHHEGAVKMAAAAARLSDPELTDFANNIIETQNDEIAILKTLLGN
jgi:uncharacterized protein (DUF305 family)